MRIAVTADLHWGHGPAGDQATRLLAEHLLHNPPDVLLLGGDIGTAEHFETCLELFHDLKCPKALAPGNHDIWVEDGDSRGDSLKVYEQNLPGICQRFGVHYLDHGPLVYPEHGLAVVGSINWYDYSWSIERLRSEVPDWQWRLRTMTFTRGRHNDRRFVQWPLDDAGFTARVVATLEQHLDQALAQVERAVVLTHHPAFYNLNFPREGPPSVPDGLLWDAFSGNKALQDILQRREDRIACVFSGHTHRAREGNLGPIRGINIGGDYRWKRLAVLDWPTGAIEYHQFGDGP